MTTNKWDGKDVTGGRYPELLAAAKAARENAFAPFSKYKVGCSVIDERGQIFSGCNVETGHYLGTHAEAAAIAAMKSGGGKYIKALVCITENGGYSCGDCRQRIFEFTNNSETICYYVDASRDDERTIASIGVLLPFAFRFDY